MAVLRAGNSFLRANGTILKRKEGGYIPPLPDTYTRLTGVRFRDRTYVRTNFRFNSTQYIEADFSYTPKTSESFNALFGARIRNSSEDQYTIFGRYGNDNEIHIESANSDKKIMSFPNYRVVTTASKYKVVVKRQKTRLTECLF